MSEKELPWYVRIACGAVVATSIGLILSLGRIIQLLEIIAGMRARP